MTLMTIGYEGLNIESFVAVLKKNGVSKLIDVRELPLSRKKGFSKSALSATVEKHGITYLHMPALGCPRDIRKDYYADQDWGRYKKRFNAYLKTKGEALNELLRISKREKCCLVCFEADYQFCHRSLITATLANTADVKHLSVRAANPSVGSVRAAA